MDTRRHRSELDTEIPARTMLGDKQLSALYDWLGKVCLFRTFLHQFRSSRPLLGEQYRHFQVHRIFRSIHVSLATRRTERLLGWL